MKSANTGNGRDAGCLVERAIRWIGGKWKLLVVRFLLFNGPSRFNQLLKGIDGISNKVLAQNLRELEALGVASREEDPSTGVDRYCLTASGSRLLPLLKGLGEWADAHTELRTAAPGSR